MTNPKGATFERLIADYLAFALKSPYIDRRVKQGAKDRGDIAGVRVDGQSIAIECKNVRSQALGTWITEAQREAVNDGALMGIVIHKRRGKGLARDQFVTMTVSDLVLLMNRRTDATAPNHTNGSAS